MIFSGAAVPDGGGARQGRAATPVRYIDGLLPPTRAIDVTGGISTSFQAVAQEARHSGACRRDENTTQCKSMISKLSKPACAP